MIRNVCCNRQVLIIAGICVFIFLFIECSNHENKNEPNRSNIASNGLEYAKYTGSVSCAKCHQKIYESHISTAHHLTSQVASAKNIKGKFEKNKNTFYYFPNIYVSAEKRGDKFYQVEYAGGIEKISKPLDLTVGSGKRGQSFLYWNKGKLFQLPLTYFTSFDQWTNSPGYANRVVYNRPITSRCMECHSTYLEKLPDDQTHVENFSTTNIVLGVSCEKCHGPGEQHVNFHTQHPTDTKAKFIINPKTFTRTQSLDMCRICHGGRLNKSKPSFSFQPGDKLADFFTLDTVVKNIAEIDVHGNQYGMMAASKCFQSSEMTCNTCHSPHENESGKKEVFSKRCISCHSQGKSITCKKISPTDKHLQTNCIDCHMSEQRSRAIMVLLQGQNIPTPAFMRSHFISIYKEESDKILLHKTKFQ